MKNDTKYERIWKVSVPEQSPQKKVAGMCYLRQFIHGPQIVKNWLYFTKNSTILHSLLFTKSVFVRFYLLEFFTTLSYTRNQALRA